MEVKFEWDLGKAIINKEKHGIGFEEVADIFRDPKRIILEDKKQSQVESRFYCIGKVAERVLLVRFVVNV